MDNITILKLCAMVCYTTIALYAIYKIWEWYNPYVDEIYEEKSIGPIYSKSITGKRMIYKRTYKNGTVKYIKKILNNY